MGTNNRHHTKKVDTQNTIIHAQSVQCGEVLGQTPHTSKHYMRHPISEREVTEMSRYLGFGQYSITLQIDSCICTGCYRDYARKSAENSTPRWIKLEEEFYKSINTYHCIICCSEEQQCECRLINRNVQIFRLRTVQHYLTNRQLHMYWVLQRLRKEKCRKFYTSMDKT